MRVIRAFSDPVLVHEPTKAFAPPDDTQIYQDIRLERLHRGREHPLTERIDMVGWPETTLYLSTASYDSRYTTDRFRDVYAYAFTTYLDEWHPAATDQLPESLLDASELDEYWRDRVDDLRYGMKKDLDKYWVEQHYDVFDPEFPKQFLLTDYELSEDQEHVDAYAQSALEEFSED